MGYYQMHPFIRRPASALYAPLSYGSP
jgi:hypothetical protein